MEKRVFTFKEVLRKVYTVTFICCIIFNLWPSSTHCGVFNYKPEPTSVLFMSVTSSSSSSTTWDCFYWSRFFLYSASIFFCWWVAGFIICMPFDATFSSPM